MRKPASLRPRTAARGGTGRHRSAPSRHFHGRGGRSPHGYPTAPLRRPPGPSAARETAPDAPAREATPKPLAREARRAVVIGQPVSLTDSPLDGSSGLPMPPSPACAARAGTTLLYWARNALKTSTPAPQMGCQTPADGMPKPRRWDAKRGCQSLSGGSARASSAPCWRRRSEGAGWSWRSEDAVDASKGFRGRQGHQGLRSLSLDV